MSDASDRDWPTTREKQIAYPIYLPPIEIDRF
jgi:hypothetical protein